MFRRVSMIMALLAGSVLAMPQGWCCLALALACGEPTASAEASQAGECCCCKTARPEKKPCCPTQSPAKPLGKCTLCVSASQKPPVKVTGENVGLDLVTLLPVPAAVRVHSTVVEIAASTFDTGPPQHVLLCVWRC